MLKHSLSSVKTFSGLLALFDSANSDLGRESFVVTAKGQEVKTAFKLGGRRRANPV